MDITWPSRRHLGLWPRFGSRIRRPEQLILPCRAAFTLGAISGTRDARRGQSANTSHKSDSRTSSQPDSCPRTLHFIGVALCVVRLAHAERPLRLARSHVRTSETEYSVISADIRCRINLIVVAVCQTVRFPGNFDIRLDAGAFEAMPVPGDVLRFRHDKHVAIADFEA